MNVTRRIAIGVAAAALLLFQGAVVAQEGQETAASGHPEVEGAWTPDACDVCHNEVTPRVVAAWTAGKHGTNNVKCFVCHGSTGQDFVAKPEDAGRCVGCHADHVASMDRPAMEGLRCASCHPAHILNPHLEVEVADDGGDS